MEVESLQIAGRILMCRQVPVKLRITGNFSNLGMDLSLVIGLDVLEFLSSERICLGDLDWFKLPSYY